MVRGEERKDQVAMSKNRASIQEKGYRPQLGTSGQRWKPSVFDFKAGSTCPTCQGTGRIPRGKERGYVIHWVISSSLSDTTGYSQASKLLSCLQARKMNWWPSSHTKTTGSSLINAERECTVDSLGSGNETVWSHQRSSLPLLFTNYIMV